MEQMKNVDRCERRDEAERIKISTACAKTEQLAAAAQNWFSPTPVSLDLAGVLIRSKMASHLLPSADVATGSAAQACDFR